MRPTPRKWLIVLTLTVLAAPAPFQSVALAANDIALASTSERLPFKDIGKLTSEQKTNILQAVQAGLLHGDPSGSFRPSDLLTRQEMAVLLTQVLKLPTQHKASSFTDVEGSSWSSPYIEAVHHAGIMNGDGNGKFRPKGKVTKEETAVLLMRAAQLSVAADSAETKVADWNRVSEWAKPSVAATLQSESMPLMNNNFEPRSEVKRQDIAGFMLSTFFPKDHLAYLQRLEDGKVWINGIEYKVADSVKGVLNPGNREVLKEAGIEFTADQRTIQSISKLEIHSSGQAASQSAPEFSGNLVLDGHGSTINGDLSIAGDYVSVTNLNVTNNFTITSNLEHDFYASHLKVAGVSKIQGGDENTVLFDASQLQNVDISKQNVHVVTQGDSSVEQMTLNSNASIENDASSTLKQVTVQSGAQQVELQGTILQLTVNSDQPTTLTGGAAIATVVVNNSASVNLSVSGTISNLQVNNPSANVSVSPTANITNTSLAPGVSSSTVSGSAAGTGTPSVGAPAPVVTNTAPVLGTKYSDQAITVGDADLEVDLLGHFTDAEQSVLKYTAASSSSAICTVKVQDTHLILKAVGKGTATITVAADDQAGKKSGTTFKVKVNAPPVSIGIPDQNKEMGSGDVTLALNTLFSDPDNDPLSYEVSITDPTIATYTLTGDQLVLTPAKAGKSNVTVKASDGRGGSLSKTFELTVTAAPNQDPIVNQTLGNVMLTVGDNDDTVDLSSVFSDPDHDSLTYEAESSDTSVATVTVNGTQVNIHAVSSGIAHILLTANDSHGGTVNTSFDAVINQPPTSVGIPDQTKEISTGDIHLTLNSMFDDPDHDTLTYTAQVDDSTIATASINGDVLTLTLLKTGETDISVKASDSRGGEITRSFHVIVTAATPQNQKPIVTNTPANQSLTLGEADYSLELGSVFADPDSDPLTFEAVSSDSDIATAVINGTGLQIHALKSGTTTIQVKANDGYGGVVSTSFQVEVNTASTPAPDPNPDPNPSGSNHTPVAVSTIYEQVLTMSVTNPRSYDLSQLFDDQDGDSLTFTAVAQQADIVNPVINGSMLTLTPGNSTGSTKITITADDGQGGKGTYNLDVRNAPLVANGNLEIRTKQSVVDPITIDLSAYFPNETSFKVYSGTPDSTFTGPTTLNGTTWVWNGDQFLSYWVIGANGSAVVIHVTAAPQGPEDLYFSQYLSIDNTRNAIELFFNPVGDTSKPVTDAYSLEIHQYNPTTNTPKVWSQDLFQFYKGNPYIFIDSTFYDYFDLINASYYNDELALFQSNTNVTTGYILKKNGQIIDVLGNPYGTTQFMPKGGTIIRKSGIRSGSSSFSQAGEWNTFPVNTLQYFSHHTP
ncbi:S-layer homology domain-containing protein [Paenibacillus sp. SN-8-1]|uniref:S-layer homology domain-containing protein n=1 Tax=Paenibacillus sp. SN-8-1 TaxID=3435409 RepID=UPI003D9A8134